MCLKFIKKDTRIKYAIKYSIYIIKNITINIKLTAKKYK